MLSLELAEKLSKAGLAWEQKFGDIIWDWHEEDYVVIDQGKCIDPWYAVWLPRLDQLLAEIEKRGYGYFDGDSLEEAARQALLWILEGGKDEKRS